MVEAYGGAFESVYVIFHPFIRVPNALAWKATRRYPTDDEIVTCAAKYSWGEVVAHNGLRSFAHLNQALLTSCGSLVDYLCDYAAQKALQGFLQSESVWMPNAGRFEPLLQSDILRIFDLPGFNQLLFVPEFPKNDPVRSIVITDLRNKRIPFPNHGSLVAPDSSFLFTVDWDSFFTLFYGPRTFVAAAVRQFGLEGFWPSPTTDHAWFNYSMGCATVTVSPEEPSAS